MSFTFFCNATAIGYIFRCITRGATRIGVGGSQLIKRVGPPIGIGVILGHLLAVIVRRDVRYIAFTSSREYYCDGQVFVLNGMIFRHQGVSFVYGSTRGVG